jgi:hypothetical protein
MITDRSDHIRWREKMEYKTEYWHMRQENMDLGTEGRSG